MVKDSTKVLGDKRQEQGYKVTLSKPFMPTNPIGRLPINQIGKAGRGDTSFNPSYPIILKVHIPKGGKNNILLYSIICFLYVNFE